MSVTAMPQTGTDGGDAPAASKTTSPWKSKKRLLLIALVAVVILAAAWFLFLRPAPAQKAPDPGQVVALEPIQVNLSGGAYLRLGLALQMTSDVKEAPDGSKALDSAIALFSGRSMEELVDPGQREALKKKLTRSLVDRYDGEVMGVYFTDFVTQ